MKLLDKFVISASEPTTTDVLWVVAGSGKENPPIMAFIEGKWESLGTNPDLSNYLTKDALDNYYTITQVDSKFLGTPTTTGTAGQILSLNDSGKTTWTNPLPGSVVDTEMSDVSPNPVQNSTIKNYVDNGLALGAVYDVSAYNDNAKFASLKALLSNENLDTLIPTSVRKGGMTIRFIQTSDNKYVQYFLTKSAWSVQVYDWEKVNLKEELDITDQKIGKVEIPITEANKAIYLSGGIGTVIPSPTFSSSYSYLRKSVVSGDVITVNGHGGFDPRLWGFIDSDGKILSVANENIDGNNLVLVAPANAAEVIINTNVTTTPSYYINKDSCNYRIDNLKEGVNKRFSTYFGSKNLVNNASLHENSYCVIQSLYYLDYTTDNSYDATEPILLKAEEDYVSRTSCRFITLFDSNGIRTRILENVNSFTTSQNEAFAIFSFLKRSDKKYQVEEGTVASDYAPYEEVLLVPVSQDELEDGSVTEEKLAEHSVTPVKTSFFDSVNLYDVEHDEDFYIDGEYALTGYIKAEPNTDYCVSQYNSLRIVTSYNTIGGTATDIVDDSLAITKTFKTLSNTNYIKIWYLKRSDTCYYLGYGDKAVPYQPYKLALPSTLTHDTPVTYFPKKVYVAVGRTIELYYDQMILNVDKYHVDATCSIGVPLDRKYQLIGTSANAGNKYTLTIRLRNDYNEVVGGGLIDVYVVSNDIANEQNILPIGDSLTNEKPWIGELATLSNSKLTCVGTRRASTTKNSEGRSGARVSFYTNVLGTADYDYDNYYRGYDYNTVATFDATASYSTGDKVKIAHTFANGTSGYKYWIFKQNHATGAFIESEAYCYSNGNPFYDYVNQKFSMNFYKTFFGISYDAIMIFLGTNGLSLSPETNVDGALGIKNLIELIREEDTTIPILIVNTIFRSSQNGIGRQDNSDGYSPTTDFKYEEDLKILKLAEAVDKLCGSMNNVYLCPVGFTHDSKYNFGNTKVAVNPRLTDTDTVYELQPLDSVHPQTCGYMQFADEMFSTLCYIFNQ